MALTKIKSSGIANAAITADQLTPNTIVGILQAGDYISFDPNGRINTTFIVGDNITIEANGRISSTTFVSNVYTNLIAGQFIDIQSNGQINATITAGDNITVEANGRISSTATGGGGGGGSGVILLSNTTITENFDIPVGQNGLSVGPVELADDANVTIAPGQRWLIL